MGKNVIPVTESWIVNKRDLGAREIILSDMNTYSVTFIIYRPGVRGIRRNIIRSDDISRGALPRGKYHH
jgi:hypothetical protein